MYRYLSNGRCNRQLLSVCLYLVQNSDYVKLGVWPDAYYLSNNASTTSGGITKAPELCALDRNRMLTGASATAQCFFPNGIYGSISPSDLDGSMPPPAGTPSYFLGLGGQLALDFFKFHVYFLNSSNSTLTGPTQIPVQSYNNLNVNLNESIPQPGVSDLLDARSGLVMYRLAYRNFGDHESLVVNHTVNAGGGVAGIRWYEIRNPSAATPAVYQQGTFSPDSNNRWVGSIAMDHAGDIALGYGVSSSTIYPSINYTGRVPSDPLGTLETEATLTSGTGSDTMSGVTPARWGYYTSMSIDPVDDCTFWYANEYLTQTSPPPVHTRIGSFKFISCVHHEDYHQSVARHGDHRHRNPQQRDSQQSQDQGREVLCGRLDHGRRDQDRRLVWQFHGRKPGTHGPEHQLRGEELAHLRSADFHLELDNQSLGAGGSPEPRDD
jgi:hypothetical protein